MGERLHFIEMEDGHVVQYSDRGNGPAVLLIHAGVFADWFVPLAGEPAVDGFRVIRLRRAGYVDGQVPTAHVSIPDHARHAAAIADRLGVRGAVVVGHSSGALVALELASARPDLVAELVLLEPAPGGGLGSPEIGAAMGSFAGPDADESTYEAFMSLACAADHRDVVRAALGVDGLDRAIKESRWFFGDEMRAVGEWSFDQRDAASVLQRTTLVVGGASPPLYRDVVDRLRGWLPHAELITVEGGDHLLPLRRPDQLAHIVAMAAAPTSI